MFHPDDREMPLSALDIFVKCLPGFTEEDFKKKLYTILFSDEDAALQHFWIKDYVNPSVSIIHFTICPNEDKDYAVSTAHDYSRRIWKAFGKFVEVQIWVRVYSETFRWSLDGMNENVYLDWVLKENDLDEHR